jgi:ABC-2 type transport system ATP-binding protein
MMSDGIAIKVTGVSKRFKLPHEKNNSIKSFFTSSIKKKQHNDQKKYEVQKALQDIDLEIKHGEFFGIVGRNGSGKSTLLKILAGIYQPTKGSVETNGRLVPFIELGVGFNPELSGRENVYLNGALLGFNRNEIDAMYDEIVEFAELERFMDQKLKNYSSGMQVRLAFSVATHAEADILLVDEVLAVGDADFQRKCFNYFKLLKNQGKTVIFVSHDMNAVREYCDRAVLIEKSKIIVEGNVGKVASAYTRMFMEDDTIAKSDTDTRIKKNRWGTKDITFTDIEVIPRQITQDVDTIDIKLTYKTTKAVKNPIFGFSVKNTAGTIMFGTNTKLLGLKDIICEVGKEATITWSIPNILNEGEYVLDLAVINSSETVQYDWWEDAKVLRVYREQHTSYAVEPKISVRM